MPDTRPTGSKPTQPTDVHDIRALTATGAIALPRQRRRPRTESGQSAS